MPFFRTTPSRPCRTSPPSFSHKIFPDGMTRYGQAILMRLIKPQELSNMQTTQQRPAINRRKFIWLSLIILVAGYIYAQPHLESWLGIELPTLDDNPVKQVENDATPPSTNKDNKKKTPSKLSRDYPSISSASSSFKLKRLKGGSCVSPAGLYYAAGPSGESRLDHIMRHSKDDPTRPVHGVFTGDQQQILETIDKAYELTLSPSSRVKSETDEEDPSRIIYTVDMQKKIGYEGGRQGRKEKKPSLNKIRLVIENQDHIITAYPVE